MNKEIVDTAKSLTKEECKQVLAEMNIIRNNNDEKAGEQADEKRQETKIHTRGATSNRK